MAEVAACSSSTARCLFCCFFAFQTQYLADAFCLGCFQGKLFYRTSKRCLFCEWKQRRDSLSLGLLTCEAALLSITPATLICTAAVRR